MRCVVSPSQEVKASGIVMLRESLSVVGSGVGLGSGVGSGSGIGSGSGSGMMVVKFHVEEVVLTIPSETTIYHS